ncbi:DUF1868 domain-containing protein [Nostoc sp. CENA67]|uniref:DUF1868 domain-containing protein n=1 Tax=Amazonocrinis nigriterrae CENA67 TaxID=2794033 RepID=A0A8J7HTU1_9NOST|nr:DUF1868 domain-containing protein [Amazonocrinis nigriterrae]MBH8565813.1 DUF1868 domain-containing protein [Amazonocrinis nigriterrae CENA67]
MDDNYQTYLNRVARLTLPEAYRSQVQHIQESSKFQLHSGSRQAAPFPGYTLITPSAAEKSENSAFYAQIQAYQQELLQLPVNSDLIVPVPPASFHLTLADLIWDSAYRDACEKNPEFEQQLRSCCAEIFQQYQQSITSNTNRILWQMLGLIVMPRAVGVCLVPQDEYCYEQVIKFRRTIYQNPKLIALGIEQHYHFTAHITLGYFGEVSPDLDRTNFSTLLSQLNDKWLMNTPKFLINRVELRKFDDMTYYHREPDWPSLDF